MTVKALSPELLDLMEHERIIEAGIRTFVEVGEALLTIREGKKYRAAGYTTFESYCSQRWGMTKQHAGNLMSAAEVVGTLEETETTVSLLPERESQTRALRPLRDNPAEMAEAWAEAVDVAGGEQPTAAEVAEVVAKRVPKRKEHPAPYSDPILDTIADHVRGADVVLDPFAGTGRVHELRDRADVEHTIGVELEPEWAEKHVDTIQGDALNLREFIEPESVDAIATSPTYGSRMADHHDAKDDSVRLTYKHSLGRDLTPGNSGEMQWGDEYRSFHVSAWKEAFAVLRPGGTFTINVKNHIRGGLVQRVVEWHLNTLFSLGMELELLDMVPTRGLMAGANHENRVAYEIVATFRKATT